MVDLPKVVVALVVEAGMLARMLIEDGYDLDSRARDLESRLLLGDRLSVPLRVVGLPVSDEREDAEDPGCSLDRVAKSSQLTNGVVPGMERGEDADISPAHVTQAPHIELSVVELP